MSSIPHAEPVALPAHALPLAGLRRVEHYALYLLNGMAAAGSGCLTDEDIDLAIDMAERLANRLGGAGAHQAPRLTPPLWNGPSGMRTWLVMDPRLPVPILGLSGGIASGKTFVAGLLEARGWIVLDADQAAREVVARDTDGLRVPGGGLRPRDAEGGWHPRPALAGGEGLRGSHRPPDPGGSAAPAHRGHLARVAAGRAGEHPGRGDGCRPLGGAGQGPLLRCLLGGGSARGTPPSAADGPGQPDLGAGPGPAGRPDRQRRETAPCRLHHTQRRAGPAAPPGETRKRSFWPIGSIFVPDAGVP